MSALDLPLPVVNGAQPTPPQPHPSRAELNVGAIWVYDGDDPAMRAAVAKLSEKPLKPGAMVQLTAAEFAAVKAGKIHRVL